MMAIYITKLMYVYKNKTIEQYKDVHYKTAFNITHKQNFTNVHASIRIILNHIFNSKTRSMKYVSA